MYQGMTSKGATDETKKVEEFAFSYHLDANTPEERTWK